jgi:hypothetical protein
MSVCVCGRAGEEERFVGQRQQLRYISIGTHANAHGVEERNVAKYSCGHKTIFNWLNFPSVSPIYALRACYCCCCYCLFLPHQNFSIFFLPPTLFTLSSRKRMKLNKIACSSASEREGERQSLKG